MIKLPCEHLEDFRNNRRRNYAVYEGEYEVGQEVVLYNGDDKSIFKVIYIRYMVDKKVLVLEEKDE